MSGKIAIHMFNVGFGDCFLVEIPLPDHMCRVLFDCGRHKGGNDANQALADQVFAAATDPDGTPRIDLVVATHRHKDHVSGFGAKGWDKVEVREVWMPWTENPDDDQARGIAERQVAAAKAALKAFGPEEGLTGLAADMFGVVGLALTNAAAMDTLYHGFAGKPVRRYLPDGDPPQPPRTLPGAAGVRLHVLGPPRDEKVLGAMDPPKAETFRKMAAAAEHAGDDEAPIRPFGAQWTQCPQANDLLPDADRTHISNLSEGADLEGLAALIDNAINNTSLVVMIEVGEANLLFCADAQWGNWQAILARPEARELIGNTTFLKVGHHASHNASPVTLISKLLPDDIPAMVSVEEKQYNNVPYPKLLDAFTDRGFDVARSDRPRNDGGYTADELVTKIEVPF